MRPNRLESLPNVVGLRVYHNGLTPEEEQLATTRRYTTEDVRLMSGMEQVEKALQGAIMGTATWTDDQLNVLKLAHALHKDKEPGEGQEASRVRGHTDVAEILAGIPKGKIGKQLEGAPAGPKKVRQTAPTAKSKPAIDIDYETALKEAMRKPVTGD